MAGRDLLRGEQSAEKGIGISRKLVLWSVVLFLSLGIPFAGQSLPIIPSADKVIHDLYRYWLAPEAANDPDITLLLYNDAVARKTGRTTPVDRALLAAALRVVEQSGARAIGIDMIFIQPTDDEDVLIDTLGKIKIPVYVAFADPESDRAAYWDGSIASDAADYQNLFWKSIDNPKVKRVSPAVGIDETGIARRWPDLTSAGNPPLAAALGNAIIQSRGYTGAITFSRLAPEEIEAGLQIATDMFPTLPIDTVTDPDLAEYFQHLLKNRVVLIGSDTFNLDQLSTPITRFSDQTTVAGVTVHAHMLRQALDSNFPTAPPWWSILVLALLVTSGGAATATIERRPAVLVLAVSLQLFGLATQPILFHRAGYDILMLPLFGLLLSWLITYLMIGYALRSRTSTERAFARDALGKFLPKNVALEILENPEKLKLEGEERPIYMLFTDLEGFTRYSHGRPPQETARILNRYLEEMSQVVLDHAGTIDKFVGDAIVAFWGAPLAQDEDAANSVACAIALHEASERLRLELADGEDTLGRTRIGLHFGQATVGNFGGERRIQYTALGDAMNIAARLEGANKYLQTDILVSEAVFKRAPGFSYRPLGAIRLSGVATAMKVFEPVGDVRSAYTSKLMNAMAAIEAKNSGAEELLRHLTVEHPHDQAILAMVDRIDRLTMEKPYELDGK